MVPKTVLLEESLYFLLNWILKRMSSSEIPGWYSFKTKTIFQRFWKIFTFFTNQVTNAAIFSCFLMKLWSEKLVQNCRFRFLSSPSDCVVHVVFLHLSFFRILKLLCYFGTSDEFLWRIFVMNTKFFNLRIGKFWLFNHCEL